MSPLEYLESHPGLKDVVTADTNWLYRKPTLLLLEGSQILSTSIYKVPVIVGRNAPIQYRDSFTKVFSNEFMVRDILSYLYHVFPNAHCSNRSASKRQSSALSNRNRPHSNETFITLNYAPMDEGYEDETHVDDFDFEDNCVLDYS